jgi:pyruvate dehydrogenase E2 component (dihydrolipoamide acetyltransferase)
MSIFALPDLGEGLQEAEIVSWHVAEGDHVVVDQPLLAVETEKAVVEIPSPWAGHIAKLLVQVGQRIQVGMPVVEFEEGPHPESGTVVGQLSSEPRPVAAQPVVKPRAAPTPAQRESRGHVRASPAVRSRARELGVDLAAIVPSGTDNTITLADVQAAGRDTGKAQEADALHGARRSMALNMARAWREVAHATLQDVADIDAWQPSEDVTCRLVRAVIAGCAAEPALNASFDGDSLVLRRNPTIDLGIAIDSADGLFVPVLRAIERGTPQEWRQQIDMLKQGVQDRSLTPDELRGATISLSNFGTIAGLQASLIVMPPQVAIVGVGRIFQQSTKVEQGTEMHRVIPLSLTFDHRAVTGGVAARFLRAAIRDLEKKT